ncbi:MAG: AAA family ATPase [Phycisphaerae bacterium]
MIKQLKIGNFRGIRAGTVENFTALNVLVGPSGSGKSTVIDALYLAGSPNLDTTQHPNQTLLMEITARRGSAGPAAMPGWLLWKVGREGNAIIDLRNDSFGGRRAIELKITDPSGMLKASENFTLTDKEASNIGRSASELFFEDLGGVRIVSALKTSANEPQNEQLPDLFSATTTAGQQDELVDLLRKIDPKLQGLQILTQMQQPFLTLKYSDYVVPVELAGDGVVSLIRFCMKLTAYPARTLLIEEPELHLHYRAIQMAARALWGAIRQGKQIILTTHSVDLIDSLVTEASEDALPKLTVFQMRCDGGNLRVNPVPGPDVKFQRMQLEAELR